MKQVEKYEKIHEVFICPFTCTDIPLKTTGSFIC